MHAHAQGNKKPRLDGEEHMAVVEEFVMAASQKWPNCLIQFEDFQTDKAFAILDRFRDKCLCFNGASPCLSGSLLTLKPFLEHTFPCCFPNNYPWPAGTR